MGLLTYRRNHHYSPFSVIIATLYATLTASVYWNYSCEAYTHGDAISLIIHGKKSSYGSQQDHLEGIRREMPRFGTRTEDWLRLPPIIKNKYVNSVSLSEGGNYSNRYSIYLSFDNYSHMIPWVDIYDLSHRKIVQDLTVTFRYSPGSGQSGLGGEIHSVFAKPTYKSNVKKEAFFPVTKHNMQPEENFRVIYEWDVIGDDVNINASIFAMLFILFIASFAVILERCVKGIYAVDEMYCDDSFDDDYDDYAYLHDETYYEKSAQPFDEMKNKRSTKHYQQTTSPTNGTMSYRKSD